jgi:hypothetical protein
VKTLLKPGKMQEIVEELAKTQLEVVAIRETRWSGTGPIKKKLQWNQRSNRSGRHWLYPPRKNTREYYRV